jgi:two-component system NtrC family sensor kinase
MEDNNRILVVDDDPGVRESYREILSPFPREDVLGEGASLFDEPNRGTESVPRKQYDVVLTDRGEEGVKAVEKAMEQANPFAAAFVDMSMPGIDGAETARRIWTIDPNIGIVIVTAYSEYTPDDIIRVTGKDDIFYLRKPFNPEEIKQFARALTNRWNLERERESLSSELERANEELEDMNKNLEKKVEEQASLLIQSEKMASIGLLAAGVAHEINNPISYISGNLTTMKKYSTRVVDFLKRYKELETYIHESETDKISTLLEEIKIFMENQKIEFILEDMVDLAQESLEGTNRIRKIISDLKTFSRGDQAEPKQINLNETIDEALTIIWNELKYRAEIVKDYGELPEVRCFPQKLSQAFMNILMNAAQAIEKKGTIKIVSRYVRDGPRAGDARVEIRISDTGRGISKKDIPKIFDPFFTTKPVGQGTGLGLSITYDIITAHGGEIMVESEKGKETTFTIRLPLKPKLQSVVGDSSMKYALERRVF